jgi:4'-phosphopantetheinyl transferase
MKFPAPDLWVGADVHVWHIDLAKHAASDFAEMFADDEIKRRNNFVFDRDRDRFTRARLAMRSILGAYLDTPARAVMIGVGSQGKPFLQGAASDKSLQFNMTHSENRAMLALSGANHVGVDLEMLRQPDNIRDLAKSVFSVAENTNFQTLSEEELVRAFFSCWTQKEAVLKALGTGLSVEAKRVHVGLDAENKEISAPPECGPHTINIRTIVQNDMSIASLAVLGDIDRVLHFDYSDTVFDTMGAMT